MESNNLRDRQAKLSIALYAHVNEICALTDAYLGKFGREDFFVLSGSEEQNKLYRKEYYAFVSKLPNMISNAQDNVASLSSLLTEADEQGEIDTIELIGSKIEAYLRIEAALAEYSSESKAAIGEARISPTRLVNAARRLKSAAEAEISNILDKENG